MKNRYSKKFNKKKKTVIEKVVLTPAEKNRAYFQALGSTRASVQMLAVSWAGLFILSVELMHIYFLVKKQFNSEPFSHPIFLFFCLCVLFMVLCQLAYFDKKFIYKYQKFSTIMLFLMINILLLSLVVTDYFLVIFSNDTLLTTLAPSIIFWSASILYFTVAFFYNGIWLRKQLRNGFSEERTNANFFAASSVYSAASLWLIFGLTLVGGVAGLIFTRSWNAMLGILSNVLFISAFSRLIVEVGYLTFLRFTDKSYWEEMPEELKDQTLWTALDIRKTTPRLILEIILFFSFPAILGFFQLDMTQNSNLLWVYRLLFFVLVIDGVISYIVHKRKQKKKSRKGKKC